MLDRLRKFLGDKPATANTRPPGAVKPSPRLKWIECTKCRPSFRFTTRSFKKEVLCPVCSQLVSTGGANSPRKHSPKARKVSPKAKRGIAKPVQPTRRERIAQITEENRRWIREEEQRLASAKLSTTGHSPAAPDRPAKLPPNTVESGATVFIPREEVKLQSPTNRSPQVLPRAPIVPVNPSGAPQQVPLSPIPSPPLYPKVSVSVPVSWTNTASPSSPPRIPPTASAQLPSQFLNRTPPTPPPTVRQPLQRPVLPPPPTPPLPAPKFLKITLTTGETVEFETEPFASGGEKIVFFSRDRRFVVGFLYGHQANPGERRSRLERILGPYNPTIGGAHAEIWKKHFCWPVGIISDDTSLPPQFVQRHNLARPVLGVVAPAYRRNFFFQDRTGNQREKKGRWFTSPKVRKLVPEEEQGNLLTYLQCCSVMASAVRRLHFAGLAHSDLSHNNVLIDPKSGDACIIDCDSLVVPGLAPPTVMGTPGYIAPEVVTGKKQPSIETDLHALAILIYETLLHRHPLRGPKVHSTRSSEEDEFLSLGEKALYVEHPSDTSNHLRPAPKLPAYHLGPHIENLFLNTFVTGLHAPQQRASASEWERALHKTLDMLHPTQDGRGWLIVGKGLPLECPLSNRQCTPPDLTCELFRCQRGEEFVNEDHSLVLWHGKYLYRWHTLANTPPFGTDKKPQAYFAKQGDDWYLVNLSDANMWLPDTSEWLSSGAGVQVKPDMKVLFSSEENGRLGIFKQAWA